MEIKILLHQPIDFELYQSFIPLFSFLEDNGIFCNKDAADSNFYFTFHQQNIPFFLYKKSTFYTSPTQSQLVVAPHLDKTIELPFLLSLFGHQQVPFAWNTILWVHQLQDSKEQDFMKLWTRWAFSTKDWQLNDSDLKDFLRELKYKQCFWNVAIENTYPMIQSLYYGLYHGIIAHEWVLGDDDKNYAFPIHGRVREFEGMDIINPIASVLALCTLIESKYATLAMQIKDEVLHHYFVNKENTTPDRGGVLNTSTYIRKLVEKLQQNH